MKKLLKMKKSASEFVKFENPQQAGILEIYDEEIEAFITNIIEEKMGN